MQIPSQVTRTQLKSAITRVRQSGDQVAPSLDLDAFERRADGLDGDTLSKMRSSANVQADQIAEKGVKKILAGGALMLAGGVASALTGGLALLAIGAAGGLGLMLDTVVRDGNKRDGLQDFGRDANQVMAEANHLEKMEFLVADQQRAR